MLRSLSFVLLVSMCLPVYGQTTIQRLEQTLTTSSAPDTSRADLLNALAGEYVDVNTARAFSLANEALDLSIRLNYRKGEGDAYSHLAAINSSQGFYFGTAQFIEKALDVFESLRDSVGIGRCYITLGHTYKRQQDDAQSEAYFRRAVSIFSSMQVRNRLAASLQGLGEVLVRQGRFAEATTYTLQAMNLLEGTQDLANLSSCYRVMGRIYVDQHEHDPAETYFHQVLDISNQLGELAHKEATSEALLYLSRLAREAGQTQDAWQYLQQSRAWATRYHFTRFLSDTYLDLVDYHLLQGHSREARQTLQEYAILNDSVTRQHNRDRAAMLVTSIEVLKVNNRNRQLTLEQQLQQEIIKRQHLQIGVAIIILLLLISILLVTLYSARQRKKLVDELNRKNESLREVNATKDKFFSIVAHDLKSPLNALQSFLMLMDIDYVSREDMQIMVRKLSKDLASTMGLADNLITWARSQMALEKAQPAPVPLKDIIEKVYLQFRPAIEQKAIHIDIQIADGLVAFIDPNQFGFILRNLLSNAIKFTPRLGYINILARQADDHVVLEVKDSGIGIPPERLALLFKIGRVSSTPGTDGEKGTGLGLLMAKEFAENNGGELLVISKPNVGSVFYVRTPVYKNVLSFTS